MKKRFVIQSIEVSVRIQDLHEHMSDHGGMYSVTSVEDLKDLDKREIKKKLEELLKHLEERVK